MKTSRCLFLVLLMAVCTVANAYAASPVGVWAGTFYDAATPNLSVLENNEVCVLASEDPNQGLWYLLNNPADGYGVWGQKGDSIGFAQDWGPDGRMAFSADFIGNKLITGKGVSWTSGYGEVYTLNLRLTRKVGTCGPIPQ